jgi:hypothetical protein
MLWLLYSSAELVQGIPAHQARAAHDCNVVLTFGLVS